ncbi:hypothetical protein [Spirosoma rhododendri]|uniref:Uncharacterized protein n=1 Tax=Spirosoma rhododendri TaxID=2728024 RepID=A0A7L5DGR5_9BACT|nr:hypothetical protein [Spirosoma rhododendri]QJD77456.1 hypothetical protein HH216_02770 [Spirosoma rhododendri]
MLPYLTVHNNGMTTTFQQTSTLVDARMHLITLLESGVAKANDMLSIVEMAEDRVIYYNTVDNSAEAIYRVTGPQQRNTLWKSLTNAVYHAIHQVQYAIR